MRSAASCVEGDVDFSFRTAFRESWGLVNLLQIAGRAPIRGLLIGDFRLQIGWTSFLGYMAGVFPLLETGKTGFEPL